ncbi:hypothetical protein TrVFT333_009983 [Trichoderma virens FT-333]|nr:hypothetical protein TrVFT333_009983 [Trichoderma virens FT-333]
MDDSEGKSSSDGVPKWQLNAPSDEAPADASPSQQESQTDKLEVARRFLDDDAVKAAPRDTKVDFLKSKGVEDEDIEHLLGGLEEAPSSAKDSTPSEESKQKALQVLENSFAPKPPAVSEPSNPILAGSDRPPVVTYPEFLTKPQRTPPWSQPMESSTPSTHLLTSARIDLHETTANRLDSIVKQLESTVSVVPSYKSSGANAASETTESEDPSEMFHRDVGTQTSFPNSPSSSSLKGKDEAQSKVQADRLSKLAKSLKGLTDDFKQQSTESQDIKVLLDVFRDDLDNMTYGHHAELFGNFDKRKKKDSEDEIRKVRDNIRRIKGVLLSARTFPTSAR